MILKRVQKFVSENKERPDLILRVCAILNEYYVVPYKSFTDFFKKLGAEQSQYKQALEMLLRIYESNQLAPKKIQRKKPYLDEKSKREYRSKRI